MGRQLPHTSWRVPHPPHPAIVFSTHLPYSLHLFPPPWYIPFPPFVILPSGTGLCSAWVFPCPPHSSMAPPPHSNFVFHFLPDVQTLLSPQVALTPLLLSLLVFSPFPLSFSSCFPFCFLFLFSLFFLVFFTVFLPQSSSPLLSFSSSYKYLNSLVYMMCMSSNVPLLLFPWSTKNSSMLVVNVYCAVPADVV